MKQLEYVEIIPVCYVISFFPFPAWFDEYWWIISMPFLQSLPDKEGKKCLFFIKCSDKSYEISASDKKKKQEWIQGWKMHVTLIMDMEPTTDVTDCEVCFIT